MQEARTDPDTMNASSTSPNILLVFHDYDDEFLRGEDYIARWGYAVDERGTLPLNGWHG
jgi:hypothetical protein